MAYNCSNIFQNPGIKNSPEKGRYSDPSIPGMGSPYNKKSCGSNYKQTSSQTATFGPEGSNPNKEIYDGIVAKSSNPQTAGAGVGVAKKAASMKKQVIKNPLGRGINTLNSQNNQKPMGKQKPCGCPKDLASCNCE